MKRPIFLFATIISATILPPSAIAQNGSGPNFDCKKARSDAEIAICASPLLAAQDRAISSLYSRVRTETPRARRSALVRDQYMFNRARDNCYGPEGNGIDCLEGSLAERVRELNG